MFMIIMINLIYEIFLILLQMLLVIINIIIIEYLIIIIIIIIIIIMYYLFIRNIKVVNQNYFIWIISFLQIVMFLRTHFINFNS